MIVATLGLLLAVPSFPASEVAASGPPRYPLRHDFSFDQVYPGRPTNSCFTVSGVGRTYDYCRLIYENHFSASKDYVRNVSTAHPVYGRSLDVYVLFKGWQRAEGCYGPVYGGYYCSWLSTNVIVRERENSAYYLSAIAKTSSSAYCGISLGLIWIKRPLLVEDYNRLLRNCAGIPG